MKRQLLETVRAQAVEVTRCPPGKARGAVGQAWWAVDSSPLDEFEPADWPYADEFPLDHYL